MQADDALLDSLRSLQQLKITYEILEVPIYHIYIWVYAIYLPLIILFYFLFWWYIGHAYWMGCSSLAQAHFEKHSPLGSNCNLVSFFYSAIDYMSISRFQALSHRLVFDFVQRVEESSGWMGQIYWWCHYWFAICGPLSVSWFWIYNLSFAV